LGQVACESVYNKGRGPISTTKKTERFHNLTEYNKAIKTQRSEKNENIPVNPRVEKQPRLNNLNNSNRNSNINTNSENGVTHRINAWGDWSGINAQVL
jgi:hypothetical protein